MNLTYLKCTKSKKFQPNLHYGQFVINALQPGQGITIGNQLRRVLLGDLGGIAISAVRIIGVNHEFSTISGVREDVLEILLNLKGIIFKGKMKKNELGKLKISGPSIITAASIQLPSCLEVVNPNHYIATISTSNILELELKFEYGVGYKLASSSFINKTNDYLQLDAIFMPVKKVDFRIESIRDIKNVTSEQLLVDIWTNGSVSPNEAIESAIKILIDLFSSLIYNENIYEEDLLEQDLELKNTESYNNIVIEELELPVRAYNCLKKAQINTVSDLLQYSPEKLLELKNFGQKSSHDVFLALKNKLGIIFK